MKLKEVRVVVNYELTLSAQEAEIILSLCRNVGGDPDICKARYLTNEIAESLMKLNVPIGDRYFEGSLTAIR